MPEASAATTAGDAPVVVPPAAAADGPEPDAAAAAKAAAKAAARAEAAATRAAAKAEAAAAKAVAQAAYAAQGGTLRTKRPPGMVKRSVALHMGYVGTEFNGLQVNRFAFPNGGGPTSVEEVMEGALFGAGLIAESNVGDLHKIKWTRNSRTDKGVHSVSTVAGLRMLLPGDERFDADPEGLLLAQALNDRLPPAVRVFSAQRVNKKFNARRMCFDRTYEYLLPAYLLTGAAPGDPVDPEAEAQALGRLRACLGLYVGTHPFHNYTARRKQYVDKPKDRAERKAAREAATAAAATAAAEAAEAAEAAAAAASSSGAAGAVDSLEEEERMAAEAAAAAAAAAAAGEEASEEEGEGAEPRRRKAKKVPGEEEPLEEDDDAADDDSLAPPSDEEPGGAPRLWVQSCSWLHAPSADPRDRVTVRHFRSVLSFTAEDPAPLVPGGIRCVRLRVRGLSFMLHQIRHMIGGGLAAARGLLPLPLLAASLAGHARAGADEARVARWSGERLGLRAGGQANLATFRRERLDPALDALLAHPDWALFADCLPRFHWDPQAQQEVMAAHAAWLVVREERARQRAAEKAAAVAAEAEAKAAAEAEAAAAAAEAQAKAAEASTQAPAAEAGGKVEADTEAATAVPAGGVV
ncbi:hypothetical protein HYH03_002406 [Edaphochlamys debaryana]|uniref:Pseudouridine synthase I TruA alpha/beta domain-containing protein n=1 Tax=Edaphochlamys debaryana TaxID=47281 RepID=A0A835YKP0_9CHLO|nr:hypothetical protein HYH03_002406 [Edaphochlamys debaryana]|eukprot:KAG2499459.1 hypothetical protein HYH03_002406 [Edaphochlamys debaryana]